MYIYMYMHIICWERGTEYILYVYAGLNLRQYVLCILSSNTSEQDIVKNVKKAFTRGQASGPKQMIKTIQVLFSGFCPLEAGFGIFWPRIRILHKISPLESGSEV